MTDSAVWAGKKIGGKKGDGFSCLHSPANDPSAPFCRSVEFQDKIGRSTRTHGGLIVEGRVTLLGKQADKKMSVKKMKSGIQFFAVNLFADPKSAPKLGKLGRRMGAEE
jgi:hypothetical protein